ncbi:MAG: hypothetical protein AB1641_29000 [Thermodesulfobacteriota bacterium]
MKATVGEKKSSCNLKQLSRGKKVMTPKRKAVKVALLSLLSLLIFLLAMPAVSGAYTTVTFGDTAWFFPTYDLGTWGTPNYTGQDVVGGPNITGGSAGFDSNGLDSVTINMVRPYGWNYQWSDIPLGDLFINVGSDSDWDYVMHDGYLYEFNYAVTNSDVYVLSSWSSNGYRHNHPFLANPDYLGDALYAVSTSVDNPWAYQTITASGLGIHLDYGQGVTLGWTLQCANDVLYQDPGYRQVPLPGAVWLLGSGLIGLLGLRRFHRN